MLFGFTISHGQTKKVENLPKYLKEPLNFGFYIGVNRADFVIHPVNYPIDTLLSIESVPKMGFNLGIIAELRLHDHVTLRFLPDLAFGERNLQYKLKTTQYGIYIVEKKVESTFIDFPLDIKYRTARINNFGAYLIGGGKYTIDLASQKGVQDKPGSEIVKLRSNDWAYEGGFGMDFYLPYFKFAIEGKLSVGIRDLLIKDSYVYSQGINKLNSKVFLFSFIFEG